MEKNMNSSPVIVRESFTVYGLELKKGQRISLNEAMPPYKDWEYDNQTKVAIRTYRPLKSEFYEYQKQNPDEDMRGYVQTPTRIPQEHLANGITPLDFLQAVRDANENYL